MQSTTRETFLDLLGAFLLAMSIAVPMAYFFVVRFAP